MLPEYIQWDKDVILQEIQLQAGIRNRAECMDVILWKPVKIFCRSLHKDYCIYRTDVFVAEFYFLFTTFPALFQSIAF